MNISDDKYIPVTESGCWIWMNYVDRDGYGRVTIKNKQHLSHRAMWEESKGEIPEGMCVCHSCDVPSCVNPDHLFLGTHKENMNDRDSKGRGVAKLTLNQVDKIRVDCREYKEISEEYKTSISNISMIKTGKNWRMK